YWAKLFDKVTLALLPADEAPVSPLEFRLRNSWRDALNTLASLGLVQALIPKSAGWTFIQQNLASTLYQPETHHGRLEVLGPLEAIDHDFDAVWISGLDNKSWPPSTRADAYVPRSLQSKLKMPGSDPALDRVFAQRALSALVATATRLVVSSASNDQDIELHPTDAIAALGLMDEASLPASTRFAESSIAQATYADSRLDEFVALAEAEPVKGGSGILSLQQEYPLAAFAQYRLGAAPLRRPVDGVGAMVRGRIIHSAAQQFYSAGRSQALSASPETVLKLCAQAVRPFRSSRDRLLQLLLDRETERTAAILLRLQALDAERPVFEVQDVERSLTVSFDTLELRLQLDRLDRLSDGLLILDYKTGRNMKAISSAGMPGELQLAIYAHALTQTDDKPLAAVGICQLHSASVDYKGIEIGIDAGDFSAFCKKNTEANLLNIWSAEVVRLAGEFEQGRAGIPEKSNYADAALYDVLAASTVTPDE
ncbi:MAG: PD-(D/E)XK nuclease family protein, partial [Pseudomonadota bacterium]